MPTPSAPKPGQQATLAVRARVPLPPDGTQIRDPVSLAIDVTDITLR